VLSIAAGLLGAAQVSGVDIDPQAVAAARDNARRNGVDADYTASVPADPAAGRYGVVLANILTQPLILLAPLLVSLLAPRGHLVLSGVLERQADAIIAAYAAQVPAVALTKWGCEDGWVALVGVAPAVPSD